MVKPMKRPDMREYFRAEIDRHVNGGFARSVHSKAPANVRKIDGIVTSSVITVQMIDGTEHKWSGGRYASRKVNLCYAPLMPRILR